MRLMLEEVIMSDIVGYYVTYVGWAILFIFATFFNTQKISLN